MSKFSKGDKVRVISVEDEDVKAGVKVGDIVTVNEDDSSVPYCVLSNGKVHAFMGHQIEHYIEPPKEITLNGATYVFKEEPRPEHEWKFGDWARHPEYGVGLVCGKQDECDDVQMAFKNYRTEWVNTERLTYISTAEIPA